MQPVGAESTARGDFIFNGTAAPAFIRSHILAGCKLWNQINTSDNDSIATLDVKFLTSDCSLQSHKLQIHRTCAMSPQIESKFRAKYLFGRMIFCEKSSTFRDQVVVRRVRRSQIPCDRLSRELL
jgi:hypothetical protein